LQAGLDVRAALRAICLTGKGRCWYCDGRLPRVQQAVGTGWDVQRVEGHRVASIILVCPKCQGERAELGEEEFLRNLSLRVSTATA
jgi:Zn finger protein HypA/HybF involved in hydrogenase expression